MAMAGYDPHAAIDFWTRMSAHGGQPVPEFMSTHPSDETRIDNIQEWMPEAMEYYNRYGGSGGNTGDEGGQPVRKIKLMVQTASDVLTVPSPLASPQRP